CRRVAPAHSLLARNESALLLLPHGIERSPLSLELPFALRQAGELLRDVRIGLSALPLDRLELRRVRIHMRCELGHARLLRDELCPSVRELDAFALHLVALDLQDELLLLELGVR